MKIGIIGASRISTSAIIEPAGSIDGVEIVGIAARDPEAAQAFANKHGIARVFENYDALIADPGVDLIYLGTPPNTHAELALKAIRAGKATLVEKPFALTAAEARHVLEASEAAGGPVFEAMHSPHHRLFGRLIEIVSSGEIGRVTRMNGVFDVPIEKDDPFRWDAALGGGALMDLGVYPLAWMRRLGGEEFAVTQAEAAWQHGVDASFSATLRFEGGAIGEARSSMIAEQPWACLLVKGEAGEVEVINPVAPQIGHQLKVTIGDVLRVETVEGPSTYEAQLIAVREALNGTAPFPFASDDFVRSMEAIEKVRAAWGPPKV